MTSADNVTGRWYVKWYGPVPGAHGRDTADGTLSEALMLGAAYVHAGSRVDVVDTFGGPTVTMGGQDMVRKVQAAELAADVLWPRGDVDAEWEADTIEEVARALDYLRPAGAEATGADPQRPYRMTDGPDALPCGHAGPADADGHCRACAADEAAEWGA